MRRVFGLIGWVISVLAVVSLVYTSVGDPLAATVQGIVGGILEYYRTARDLVFNVVGAIFSEALNYFRQWLGWLPPAPWFSLSASAKDFVTAYSIIAGAIASVDPRSIYWSESDRSRLNIDAFHKAFGLWHTGLLILGVFWPLTILLLIKLPLRKFWSDEKQQFFYPIHRVALIRLLILLSVTTGVFLVGYAENKIGL